MKKTFSPGVLQLRCLPASPEDRMLLETVTLSSEFLAQSTMPLQPFMGKVMSVAALAGSLWMPRTRGKEQINSVSKTSLNQFTHAEKNAGGNSGKSGSRTMKVDLSSSRKNAIFFMHEGGRHELLSLMLPLSEGPVCTKPGKREVFLLLHHISRSGQNLLWEVQERKPRLLWMCPPSSQQTSSARGCIQTINFNSHQWTSPLCIFLIPSRTHLYFLASCSILQPQAPCCGCAYSINQTLPAVRLLPDHFIGCCAALVLKNKRKQLNSSQFVICSPFTVL